MNTFRRNNIKLLIRIQALEAGVKKTGALNVVFVCAACGIYANQKRVRLG
jgi:hypothetical protein